MTHTYARSPDPTGEDRAYLDFVLGLKQHWARALFPRLREQYDAVAPKLRGRLDESKGMLPAVYDEAMRVTRQARITLTRVLEDVDVLLAISAPGAAPKGLSSTGDARGWRMMP